MIQIDIEDRAVVAALTTLRAAARDLKPAMRDISVAFSSESKRQFAKEVGPDNTPWARLRPVTVRQRKREGKWPGKKLRRSGQLAASVTPGANEQSAWIGSNKPYAAMHFFGGTTSPRSAIPNKQIPARPFLPMDPGTKRLSPSVQTTALELLQRHLARALK